jgi:DNA-binding CsgD family transcriptional regulator
MGTPSKKQKKIPAVSLTPREVEVLILARQGKSQEDIAASLTTVRKSAIGGQVYEGERPLSRRSVQFALQNVYKKLKVNSIVQALNECKKLKLLPKE